MKGMRGPPVPPEKFVHSDVLKILVGPNSKQFNIHSGLLEELSPWFNFVDEDDEEPADYLEMNKVSEETMTYFSEFCYTGDYNVHIDPNTMDHVTWDVEDRQEALAHARLYVFAKEYNIEALEELAVGNLGEFMGNPSDIPISVIPCLVEYALENIPEDSEPVTDRLVAFLARCTASMMHLSSANRELAHSLLASISRKDFFASFCENVTYSASAVLPEPSGASGQGLQANIGRGALRVVRVNLPRA